MPSLAVFRGYSLTSRDRLQEDFFLSMQRSKNLPIPLKNSKIRINAWEATDNFNKLSEVFLLSMLYPTDTHLKKWHFFTVS
jgi:hypothetical protein